MNRRTPIAAPIALSAAALFAAASAFAADGAFDKTLSVSGAPTVSVSTGSGYIHVSPGSDNKLHIVGFVHAQAGWMSGGDSGAVVRQIVADPPITQTGNIITIGHADGHYSNGTIDYDISVPRATLLTARTGSGNIEVGGLSGSVTAESGSGTLHLALSNSGEVHTRTGSGSIHIEGATGALRAGTGSGSIEISGNVGTDWNLSTGSGSIRVRLPDNARFSLNASTGSGSVHVDQPLVMQGSFNHHHVSGAVNGGGPMLHASTGSGSITINGDATAAQLRDNNSLHVPGATDCVDNRDQAGCSKR